ncbi:MAG: FdtA/QdtA family cupin domain-containing protein [Fibrobacterales bacterium]
MQNDNSVLQTSTVYNCSVIELPKKSHEQGNMTIVENSNTIPFDVNRVYYLYDVPGGESRGGHAHRELRQLLVAASGCFDVILDDGKVKRTITLNRPNFGLLVVPGIWRELVNFSSGAICLVLASHVYSEEDYVRNYSEFLEIKK